MPRQVIFLSSFWQAEEDWMAQRLLEAEGEARLNEAEFSSLSTFCCQFHSDWSRLGCVWTFWPFWPFLSGANPSRLDPRSGPGPRPNTCLCHFCCACFDRAWNLGLRLTRLRIFGAFCSFWSVSCCAYCDCVSKILPNLSWIRCKCALARIPPWWPRIRAPFLPEVLRFPKGCLVQLEAWPVMSYREKNTRLTDDNS